MIEDGSNPPFPDDEGRSLEEKTATGLASFFDNEESSDIRRWRSVVDPTVKVVIERLVPERRSEDFTELLKLHGMSFPVYSFDMWSNSHVLLVPTPYGVLPSVVVGPDENIYGFVKEYYFDTTGCSCGRETVAVLEDEGQFDRKKMMKLNFIPSEEDMGMKPLDAKDYQKVLFHLGLIDSEQFVPDE